MVIGEVVHFYIRDELVEAERFYIERFHVKEELRIVGRMGGGRYTRTRDLFDFRESLEGD